MLRICAAEFVLHYLCCIFGAASFLCDIISLSKLAISPDLRGVRARFLHLRKAQNLTLQTKFFLSRTFFVQSTADSTNRKFLHLFVG